MTITDSSKTKRTRKALLKLPVKFKNLSVGDTTATIGFSVSRDRCNIMAADEMFCGKRLRVRIVVGGGDNPEQTTFWDDLNHDVDGIADVKKFSASPKLISAGLAFPINETDVMQLTHFAKQEGWLFVIKAAELAKDEGPEEDEDEEEEDEE